MIKSNHPLCTRLFNIPKRSRLLLQSIITHFLILTIHTKNNNKKKMSWLARSIADSLRIDDDEDVDGDDNDNEDENNATPIPNHSQSEHSENEEENDEDRAGRGVREDLSEFTETLTRQLWGVATFLAPPPPPPPPPPLPSRHRSDRSVADHSGSGEDSDEDGTGSVGISGNHDEVVEGFRNGLSDRSSNQVVSEIWQMDSNFLPYEEEDPIGDAVGITEEVLAFAMNIAHHPETWLDFPLEEEDDIDDFDMSDTQLKHVLAIQRLANRLAALRIELCPAHMSEGYFWKVYFVLLHSRLNTNDAKLLSTPQIVAARAMWMKELQKRTKAETDWFGRGTSYVKESANTWQQSFDNLASDDAPGNMSLRLFAFEPSTYSVTTELETEKHPVLSTEMQIVDKSVIEEEPVMKTKHKDFVAGPSFKVPVQNYDDEDDDDDWLKDDSELVGYSGTAILLGNNEDVSFSDLEDDDDDWTMPIKSATTKTS